MSEWIFFAQNGFQHHQKWGTDTKNLKIGPNLAVLGQFCIFSSATLLCKVYDFKRKYKIYLKWPNLVRFSNFLCLYPHFWMYWIHFRQKNSIRQFPIRKNLKIRPNLVVLWQFSYITKHDIMAQLFRPPIKKIIFSIFGHHLAPWLQKYMPLRVAFFLPVNLPVDRCVRDACRFLI